MKNRRLIILISCFSFIVLIIVLCSSIFSVKKIDFVWGNERKVFANLENTELYSPQELEYKNMFLVNKKQCIEDIESKFPYIKVEKVEKVYPNKIILTLSERQEMFVLKIKDDMYVYLDNQCRVLKITDDSVIGSPVNPCMLYFDGMSVVPESFVVGKDADIELKDMIVKIANIIKECGCSVEDSWDFLKDMTITTSYSTHLKITSNYGLTMIIRQIETDFDDKLKRALDLYQKYKTESRVGEIYIFTDGKGEISATFTSF